MQRDFAQGKPLITRAQTYDAKILIYAGGGSALSASSRIICPAS